MMSPHYWETKSAMFMEDDEIEMAIRCLWHASACSIGHNRAARYEAQARRIARDAIQKSYGRQKFPPSQENMDKWEKEKFSSNWGQ